MKIRKFRDSDVLSIYLINMESWIKEVSRYYNKKLVYSLLKNISPKKFMAKKEEKRITLVAEDKKEVIGFISIGLKRKTAKIGGIYLSYNFMGKGIGTELYKKAEILLKEKGVSKIYLYSSISPRTVRFYQKNGFRIIKKMEKRMRNIKIPVIEMEKAL